MTRPEEFRLITRAHVIAWRRMSSAGSWPRQPSGGNSRHSSSLFEYLCERNAVTLNPVKGVKWPKANNNEGTTPALSDAQGLALLKAPPSDTLKGVRDCAVLATLLFHGIRREELCKLRVRDYQRREGILHICIEGKGDRVRFIPVATEAQQLIHAYVETSGHGEALDGPLFRPVKNHTTGHLRKALNPKSVYQEIVRRYGTAVGITVDVHGFCVHSLRATAATNALAHNADIAKV